jgi:hypothetical protein
VRINAHIDKFRQIDQGLSDVEATNSLELWIWGAQNSLTHLYNAALHTAGLTNEYDTYPKQLAGVYVAAGEGRSLVQDDADVLHTNLPLIHFKLPVELHAPQRSLARIEKLANDACRSTKAFDRRDLNSWRESYISAAFDFLKYLDADKGWRL